jgi:hypothetical protein
MLVWINGAFGAGKTAVAAELARRWPAAIIFDPEQVGFILRRVLPAQLYPGDFQDLTEWRQLTVQTGVALLDRYQRPLIVPMALANPAYFDEVIGGLHGCGVDVRHFTLIVSVATLRRRIRRHSLRPSARTWALAQVDRCVPALAHARFQTHLDNDTAPISQVVDVLLDHLPSPLPTTVTR